MYKLIAVDMDGTLLRNDKTISNFTKDIIDKARANGKYVVLCSGRPIEGLTKYLEELKLTSKDDYVISFNGALVQSSFDKAILGSNKLKGRDFKRIYEMSRELGVHVQAFSKLGLIAPVISKYTEVEASINNIEINIVDINDINDDEDIWKVMMVDEEDKLQAAIDKLPEALYDEYTIVRSAPFFLEFLNNQANKGSGIEILAQYLGIDRKEVIAIGDADNDRHMIKYAGLGVAMENATTGIKKISNYITSSNEEDGVAKAIDKFMLKV